MFTTAVIRGSAAQGYSSGQAMEIMEQIARDHLPDNIGLSGVAFPIRKRKGRTDGPCAYAGIPFSYSSLAAQYESWTVPIAVLLSLPVAALGAYLGVVICGLENDIYLDRLGNVGGLAAKNAILIVEFAKVQVRQGRRFDTVCHPCPTCFRPISDDFSCLFCIGNASYGVGKRTWFRQAVRPSVRVFSSNDFAIVFGIVFVLFFFVWYLQDKAKVQIQN